MSTRHAGHGIRVAHRSLITVGKPVDKLLDNLVTPPLPGNLPG